jgi:tetratricopeptide (TPR) repeat protein
MRVYLARARQGLIYFSVAVMTILLMGLFMQQEGDPDLYIHLRDGRQWVENNLRLSTDNFSYTLAAQPLERAEVAFRVILYRLWQAGGFRLLIIWKAAVMAAAVFLLGLAAWQRWRNLPMILTLMGLSLILSLMDLHPLVNFLHVRPYIFTYLFIPATLLLLEKYNREPSPAGSTAAWLLFLIPAYTILWVNLHPGFILVYLLLAAYLLENLLPALRHGDKTARQRAEQLGIILGATALASLINPLGAGIYELVFSITQNDLYGATISEWLPTSQYHFPSFFMVLAISWAVLILNIKRLRIANFIILAAVSFLALKSLRHVAVFYFTSLPLVMEELAGAASGHPAAERQLSKGWPLAALLTSGLIAAAIYFISLGTLFRPELRVDTVPERALAWLESHPITGNVHATFGWGGYIGWQTRGRIKIFMDGQIDHYGLKLYRDNMAVEYGLENWQEVLDRYGVNVVLTSPQGPGGCHDALVRSQRWALVFFDDVADLFVKRNTGNDLLIQMNEYQSIDPFRSPFFDERNMAASLAELDRAIAVSPNSYVPLYLKGDLLLRLGMLPQAGEIFVRVLALSPGHLGSLTDLGLTYLQLNRLVEAEARFRQALAATTNPGLRANLEYFMAVLTSRDPGRLGEAVSWARKALKAYPRKEVILTLLDDLNRKVR